MKMVIRADASVAIGIGHLMRCLSLAEALRKRGAKILFICREVPGSCRDVVMAKGFPVCLLSGEEPFDAVQDAEQTASKIVTKPDWLVVDHYGIGLEWERRLRPQVGRIMVIDDLADRPHDCDLLLDQNLFDDMARRYNGLTPHECRLFLGPQYALFRGEFITARQTLRERDGIVRRILIFFGGSDPTNETEKTLLAIQKLKRFDIALDIVVGTANPNSAKICGICTATPNAVFHRQIGNMAELMANADLAIGAGGTTTWERCFLGLPALIVVVADNQIGPSQAADNKGLVRFVGKSAEVTVDSLVGAIGEALRQPDELAVMATKCLTFIGQREAPVNDKIVACLNEVSDVP
jgi:UDP-2,4-diacetamido-2,4,6-trideoxy-beta-L-altropyranose hydrolase